jgi:hypothetical protein
MSTASATPTSTPIDTDTPNPTPTSTASATPTGTVTLTPTGTATTTPTPVPTVTETPSDTPSDTPSPTPTDTPPNPCDTVHALALPPTIDQIWVGDTMANLDGTTAIVVEGSIDNTAQAFWTDPRACSTDAAPLFHWVIITPNTVGYTAQGITGYRTDTLTFLADSIPNFGLQTITFVFTVTSQVPTAQMCTSKLCDDGVTACMCDGGATTCTNSAQCPLFPTTTKSFKVAYRNSALTLSMSTTCQTMQQVGMGCNIQAALAVPPGTPT